MPRGAGLFPLCLAACLLSTFGAATADVIQPVVRSYDLDVSFSPEERTLSATALIRFVESEQAPPTVVFYLHGELVVESVTIGESDVPYVQESVYYFYDYSLVAKRVTVETGGREVRQGMKVSYAGPFNRSRARTPSDYMRIDADGVLLRSYGYSLWFPVFLGDDRDSHAVDFPHVVLRTPAEFTTVFTGTHQGDRVEAGTRISTWSATGVEIIDAQCTSRRFEVAEHGSIKLYHERNAASAKMAGEIARFARRLDGIYRRDYRKDAVSGQLHIMQMPRYGEISSDNVVGMTDEDWESFTDYFHGKTTLAHELIHPFVQLKTDRDDPLYAVAVEGFPAFLHYPALAELGEQERYDKHMTRLETAYLERKSSGKDRRGRRLPVEKPLARIEPDEIGRYKDSFVLGDRAVLFQNWLRTKMGVEGFRRFTRELFAASSASYDDFRRLVLKYLPDAAEDIALWMETSDYPERIRLPAL